MTCLILVACSAPPYLEAIAQQASDGDIEGALSRTAELLDEDPDQPRLQLLRGELLYASGEIMLATWPLRKALTDPELLVPAGLLLSRILIQTGNSDDALPTLEVILAENADHQAANADHQAARFLYAQALIGAEREVDAVIELDRLLESDPLNLDIFMVKLRALFELEREDEAAEVLAELRNQLEGSPEDYPEELRARLCAVEARFAFEREEAERATGVIESCLEEHPTDLIVISEAIEAFGRKGQRSRILDTLRNAYAQKPEDASIRASLVSQLTAQDQLEEAERILSDAVENDDSGSRATALGALYEFYWQIGKQQEALGALERMITEVPEPTTAITMQHADALIAVGELDRAAEVAASLDDGYRHLVLGRVELARGNSKAALGLLEEGIRSWPDNATSRWLAGNAADDLGDMAGATNHFIEAVRIEETQKLRTLERTDSAWRVARFQAAAGYNDGALYFLQKHLDHHPMDVDAWELLARVAFRLGARSIEARAIHVLGRIPGAHPRVWTVRAELTAERRGHLAAAQLLGQSRLELSHQANLPALRALVRHLLAANEHAAALARVDRTLLARPDGPGLHALRGLVLEAEGSADAARGAFERGLALDSQHTPSMIGLARILAESGDIADAVELLDRAYTLDAGSAEAGYLAAALLRDQGMQKEAEERFSELVAAHPFDTRSAVELARIRFSSSGPSDMTLAAAQRAALFQTPDALALLGEIQLQRGDADAAVDTLRRAVATSEASALVHYRLALALVATGEEVDAMAALQVALESGPFSQSEEASRLLARLSEQPEDQPEGAR
jgi:predicted Zn-dependent protease